MAHSQHVYAKGMRALVQTSQVNRLLTQEVISSVDSKPSSPQQTRNTLGKIQGKKTPTILHHAVSHVHTRLGLASNSRNEHGRIGHEIHRRNPNARPENRRQPGATYHSLFSDTCDTRKLRPRRLQGRSAATAAADGTTSMFCTQKCVGSKRATSYQKRVWGSSIIGATHTKRRHESTLTINGTDVIEIGHLPQNIGTIPSLLLSTHATQFFQR